MRRIGIDVGGTFTDLIFVDDDTGQIVVHKVPSTPDDPSRATLAGALELCSLADVAPAAVDQLLHGTTVATNVLLEHKGANVGLITTEGFRDVLHIARSRRPITFSAYQDIPWQVHPLVKRRNRLVVPERVAPPDGQVITPLDEEAVRAAVRTLRERDIEAVAVAFLFSFLNPTHERRVREIIEEEWPSVPVFLRHEVAPQFREYEAFSTTSLNAYVAPSVARYFGRLRTSLLTEGFTTDPRIMTSSGGIATVAAASAQPVNTLLSGPVAGLIGGIWAGQGAGQPNVITLDVGGTSADIGVAPAGERRFRHVLERVIAGYHLSAPMLDIDTIGAGGGSIAYVDEGGMLNVGPQSAGAAPGPACYGRGGTEPTVTDALVVLGRVRPESFLGGRMTIDAGLAEKAVGALADRLGLGLEVMALGIVDLLTHNMVQAIEESSVQKGYDPREFTLVAMGGAGPLFGWPTASEMAIPKVLVPLHPGVTSALGLLAADFIYDFVATAMEPLDAFDASHVEELFAVLGAQARDRLMEDGIPGERIVIRRLADCRYAGQGYELRVPTGDGEINETWAEQLIETFHTSHERAYSRRFEGRVQLVNVHIEAVGLSPGLTHPLLATGSRSPQAASVGEVEVVFARAGGGFERHLSTAYDRKRLLAGNRVEGPAIIEQLDSTTVVPPGVVATVDPIGNLLLEADVAVGASTGAAT